MVTCVTINILVTVQSTCGCTRYGIFIIFIATIIHVGSLYEGGGEGGTAAPLAPKCIYY